ncbi:GNAT family N-acetyltransferase [Paenibacillus radicis (ex Gao et al. 2016)]|uniref:Acetyltransferase n=1 Tax=Paenibacillus radicis (ex Gao et al. 2016) TaxID=1737354 RepID=A0A917M1Y5_9BACL|nr:GNAT family N-acetyltransferase [Paenibacillus radicis (ex Gao et al. 2016)]GGG72257.1 acetyltransferase [Paenibacillus radicis (ex Gao et al. 2016)]
MKIEVRLTDKADAYIIKNMYPLYLHDLSGHYGLIPGHTPNKHGIFEDGDHYITLNDQYDVQNIWWEHSKSLYPYLITADDRPAGFALIATPPYCSQGVDYFVSDFFILQPFRGNGVAEYAIRTIFERFTGKWEVFTNPSQRNVIGQKFWRRTVSHYTKGNYEEGLGSTFDGEKLIFKFSNSSL